GAPARAALEPEALAGGGAGLDRGRGVDRPRPAAPLRPGTLLRRRAAGALEERRPDLPAPPLARRRAGRLRAGTAADAHGGAGAADGAGLPSRPRAQRPAAGPRHDGTARP